MSGGWRGGEGKWLVGMREEEGREKGWRGRRNGEMKRFCGRRREKGTVWRMRRGRGRKRRRKMVGLIWGVEGDN